MMTTAAGSAKLADDRQGAVQVQQVVVGKLLAVELPGGDHAGAGGVGPGVEGRLLVRVLAVAQHRPCASSAMVIVPGKGPSAVCAGKEVGDRPIVARPCGRRPRRPAGGAAPSVVQPWAAIWSRISEYCAASVAMVVKAWFLAAARTSVGPPMSICSIASSSVTPWPGDGGLEGIEVHHHQLEGEDAVLGQGLHVLGIVVAAEDAAVDLRMEGLQPAVHHFREAGVLGDVADGDALAFQVLAGAAGAVDFHAGGGQPAGETGQPQLVADADQGTLNARGLHNGTNLFGG